MRQPINKPFPAVRPNDYPCEMRSLVIDYVREHCTVDQVFHRCSEALRRAMPSLWRGEQNLVDDAIMQRASLDDLLRAIPVSVTDAFLADYLVYSGQGLNAIPVDGERIQYHLTVADCGKAHKLLTGKEGNIRRALRSLRPQGDTAKVSA